jgi:CubicO group peptidase (beta-lactamase class C family)
MRTRRAMIMVVAALMLSSQTARAQTFPPAGLDAEIERAMKELSIPGIAVAVVKDDSVVFSRGYGVRKLGSAERVDVRTIFAVGSTTKAFTAAAVGAMVDDGKLGWDDRAIDRLPGFALHDPNVTREIRVRDLLSHKSGLGRRGDALWYGTSLSKEEVLARIAHLPPATGFRTSLGYQNIMFLAAGESAARAAGMTWDELVRTRIFTPLGMTDATTSVRDLPAGGNVAAPHSELDGQVREVPWRMIDNVKPAGSINAHVLDMSKWVRMWLGDGAFGEQRVLSDSVVHEILTPQIYTPVAAAAAAATGTHFRAYGMGWVLEDYRGRKLAWHNGGIDGMKAQVVLVPKEKLGVVVLANLNGTGIVEALGYRIVDAYLGAQAEGWVDRLVSQARAAQTAQEAARRRSLEARAENTTPSLPLEAYAGTYHNAMYGNISVVHESGKLRVQRDKGFSGEMSHWQHDAFRIVWDDVMMGEALVAFTLNTDGKPATLRVDGLDLPFDRAK